MKYDEIVDYRKKIIAQADSIGNLNDSKVFISEIKSFIKMCHAELKLENDLSKKRDLGKALNILRTESETIIEELDLKFNINSNQINNDFTIKKENIKYGSSHPLINLCKLIEKIFLRMGFSIVNGPEIELDRYNFEKLNMPAYHPARDMQDTFYISSPQVLLRSHTSSVQVRCMQETQPPIRIISPGTVYRVDDIDPQHTPMFYQLEGLLVDEGISFSNLKAVLILLLKNLFDSDIKVRFRPSYYPYTEPSAAVDMSCTVCGSNGCEVCAGSGWITVLGSGMVHPEVLEGVGYDSQKYTGFAFGLGLNRLALLFYNLGEIKKIYENDVSLWRQLN